MKSIRKVFFFSLTIAISISACAIKESKSSHLVNTYVPDDLELYKTIVHLDSIFFDAYNVCNLEKQAAFYSNTIEFYHDKGGLMNSKQDILDATERNICGKVTRELVESSIEVYPIKDYGAVEIGLHMFHNNQEPVGTPSKIGKFILFWELKNNTWKIAKIISLH